MFVYLTLTKLHFTGDQPGNRGQSKCPLSTSNASRLLRQRGRHRGRPAFFHHIPVRYSLAPLLFPFAPCSSYLWCPAQTASVRVRHGRFRAARCGVLARGGRPVEQGGGHWRCPTAVASPVAPPRCCRKADGFSHLHGGEEGSRWWRTWRRWRRWWTRRSWRRRGHCRCRGDGPELFRW